MAKLLLAAADAPAPAALRGGDADVPGGLWAGTATARPRPGREPDAAGDTLPRIDRIVLYIDDLDRCPPDRVVEVLEAVHLLLAGELFVVVVAVDPRWMLRAIRYHYRDLFTGHPSPGTPASSPPARRRRLRQPRRTGGRGVRDGRRWAAGDPGVG